MSRRPFTLIFPYYENPAMLAVQFKALAGLPEEVRSALHLIVADDGSPKHPIDELVRGSRLALPPAEGGLASFQAFQIEVDVRWNWLACRNLAAHHAKTDWLLMTDIDHMVPEATARRIQEQKLDPIRAYRFSRVDAPDLTPYKAHPNSWLFTRDLFDKIGGYDERFSGYYGTDGEFRDRVRANAKEIIILPEVLVRYPREVVADASTTTYGRKESQDHEGVTRIRAQIASEGGRPRRLSFPYHQVV